MYEVDGPECSKRYCSLSPSSDTSSDTSSDSSSDSSSAGSPVNEPVKGKEFYEGKNGIIKLREKIISIVDPTPRTIHQYALAALRKPGTFFVQTKSELLGPFFITPSPKDIPKGELVMIYEVIRVAEYS
ncbi:hypothetical protein GCK72_025178 [Caenorhabditis remanei]|uniref:Uncharacterized protein n=1 Tax=Caenorhabditis remanei TaxID=31234 RepID=A0A6A5G1S2_CAERE|nr:hypothetical protein GCK72_025178 [Caenorhabditis remanei]KAF1748711.1 hypothetical protein GCK72_025178 [Caenorhabditis remanei]